MTLQSNATLTAVAEKVTDDEWEGPAPSTQRWAGSERVYLRDVVDRVFDRETRTVTEVRRRELIVPTALASLAEVRVGDILTVDGQAVEVTSVSIPTIDDPDIPDDVRTARLGLLAT